MKARSAVPLSLLLLGAIGVGAAGVANADSRSFASIGSISISLPPPASVPTVIHLPPVLCGLPTAAFCADSTNYLTGKYAAGSCGATQVASCASTMKGAYNAAYSKTGSARPELDVASGLPIPADNLDGNTNTSKGRFGDFAGPLSIQSNTDPSYEGSHFTSIVRLTSKALPAQLRMTVRPIGAGYMSDGTTLSSCDEYAYKSFWDYEIFRDDALSCRDNFHCVYDAVYNQNGHTKGIAFKTLKEVNQRDPLPDLVGNRVGNSAKNPFFAIPADALANAVDAASAPYLAAIQDAILNHGAGSYYNVYDPSKTSQGPSQYSALSEYQLWQYIHNQPTAQAASDAQYEDQDRRVAEIHRLVGNYILAVATAKGFTWTPGWQPYDPSRVMDPDPLDYAIGYRGTATDLVSKGIFATSSFPGLAISAPVGGGVIGMPGGGSTVIKAMFTGGVGVGVIPTAVQALQNALVAEAKRPDSCLNLNNFACDWSPKAFAQHYMSQFKDEKQAAFDSCMEVATASFNVPDTEASAPAPKSDVPNMKAWIPVHRATLLKQFASVPQYPGGIRGAIGRHIAGGGTLGDPSLFGATASYDFDWHIQEAAVKTGTTDACAFSGAITANVDVDGSVFGKSFSALHSDNTMNVDPTVNTASYSSKTTFFGTDVYTPQQASGPSSNEWTLAQVPDGYFDLVDASYPFMVVVVPVTISGSAQLSYGVTLDVKAGATDACKTHAVTSAGKPNPMFGADMALTPHVSLDAVASIACGVPGFELGVKGTLTLARIDAPITGGIDIVQDAASGTGLGLSFSTAGDLNYGFLSGNVAAFAQLALWEYDATLFSWSGLQNDYSMWKTGKVIGLDAFQFAQTTPKSE